MIYAVVKSVKSITIMKKESKDLLVISMKEKRSFTMTWLHFQGETNGYREGRRSFPI